MIGLLGQLGLAVTLRQHCPSLTQRPCTIFFVIRSGFRIYGLIRALDIAKLKQNILRNCSYIRKNKLKAHKNAFHLKSLQKIELFLEVNSYILCAFKLLPQPTQLIIGEFFGYMVYFESIFGYIVLRYMVIFAIYGQFFVGPDVDHISGTECSC